MKTLPISTVITAYNSAPYIAESIGTVKAQTMAAAEIIVVDNNSDDGTKQIAKNLGARVFNAEKQCPAATRNCGIAASTNDWIAFLDADDIWDKKKLEYQWRAIQKYPDARIISCDSAMFTDPGNLEKHSTKLSGPIDVDRKDTVIEKVFAYSRNVTASLFRWFWIIPSSVILHREVFDKIGVFDESLFLMEDMDLFCRALKHFPVATVNKNLAFYRRHNQNTTLNSEILERYEIILINEYVSKFPERYVAGTLEYLIERQKPSFVAKGMALSERLKNASAEPENRKL